MARSFHHSDFQAERIAAERRETVAVCVPAREEAGTIGPIVEALARLKEQGVIDQLLVVDADSTDGTGEIAAARGAEVIQQGSLLPEMGPVLRKGDALGRRRRDVARAVGSRPRHRLLPGRGLGGLRPPFRVRDDRSARERAPYLVRE